MFGAYFDDSKIPGNDPLMTTMACYIASAEQWDMFKVEWDKFLVNEGLEALHMSELTFRHNGQRVGAYRYWDDVRERSALQRAHDIIHQTPAIGVAMTVDVSAYKKVVPIALNALMGGPAGFCVFQCLKRICDEGGLRMWQDPIACFFESNSGYGNEITTLRCAIRRDPEMAQSFKSLRPKHWTFTDKMDAPPLQAADLLAYESNHFWHNMFFGDSRTTKKSFNNLILQDAENHWGSIFREAKLREFVKDYGG